MRANDEAAWSRLRVSGEAAGGIMTDSMRCARCGAKIEKAGPREFLTLREIMARYKIGRTKSLDLRREIRLRNPEALRRHGRIVRVAADAIDLLLATT